MEIDHNEAINTLQIMIAELDGEINKHLKIVYDLRHSKKKLQGDLINLQKARDKDE